MKRTLIAYLILPILLISSFSSVASDIHLTTLPNGLRVYTQENHARPLVSLFCIVDGGSRTETRDIAGLSHFYEHLIARGGSKKQAETEYRRQMMILGQSHIYTYDDGTAYGFTVPRENFSEALWRLADFMMDLIPDTAGIRKERTIVSEELHMSYTDNPEGRAYEQLLRAAFTQHPYYPTTIGLKEVIESADLEKLRTFYEERYVPNQIVMAVVGDFETKEIIAKIEEQFGHYPPGRISFELGLTEPPQTAFRQVSDSMDVSASYIMLGYRIPPTASPDMPAIKVLAHILGGGSNSRLYKALKVEEDLVYSVYAYPDFLRDESLLYIGMQCHPEKEEAAVEKTLSEIQRLGREGITGEELSAARKKLIADDIAANETYRGQAETICRYAIGQAPSLASHYRALVRSVTEPDVHTTAWKYLDVSQATLSLVVPKGESVRDYTPIAGKYSLLVGDESQLEMIDPGPHYTVLPGGLTVITRMDAASPTVCVQAFIRGGQWLESGGKSGVGYLTAEMLDKGTEDYTRAELAAAKEDLAINVGNFASEDYLQVGFKGPSVDWRKSVELLDQMLFHPSFPQDEFEKARVNHLQAIRAVEDQPWEFTHREALRDLYEDSPYGHLVVGSEKIVAEFKREDVVGYYDEAFVPSNIVIVAVGDFAPHEFIAAAEELWGDLPKKRTPKIKLVEDQPAKSVKVRHVFKQRDQNTFNISFLTVGVNHPDFLPLVLAKRILNTRLFFKYVYEKGMAYRMWTRMHPRMGQARFYFEMGVSDENYPIATAGILQDLGEFLKQPISAEDLEIAKKDEITRHKMTYQTNRGIADGLAYWEAVGLGYQFFEEFPERLNAITAKEVEKASRKYLSVDRYQLVNIGTARVE